MRTGPGGNVIHAGGSHDRSKGIWRRQGCGQDQEGVSFMPEVRMTDCREAGTVRDADMTGDERLAETEMERRSFDSLIKGKPMFEALFESAPDTTVLVSGDGRILLVNRQTERMFGYARDELIGQP